MNNCASGKTAFIAAGASLSVFGAAFVVAAFVVVFAVGVFAFAARFVVVVSVALEHADAKVKLTAIADKIKICFIFSPDFFLVYFAG